ASGSMTSPAPISRIRSRTCGWGSTSSGPTARMPKRSASLRCSGLHTMGSAEAPGIADRVGSLEPGKYADFLVVDPRAPDLGPLGDPVASYVLACGLRNLKAVYVGGRCVSRDGVSEHPLAARASEELHARLGRIAARVAPTPEAVPA